jgi:hypothetical protein
MQTDPTSSILLLDKLKAKDSSILNMIFFTIMLSIANYFTKQLSYMMEDMDLKSLLNYELLLHTFRKKNSIEFEGKITCGTLFYSGELNQTCVFSERFKAIWEHIIATTNTNPTIHSIKEHKIGKTDTGIYMVNQKDKFLISDELQIYAYTYIKEDATTGDSKENRPTSKISNIVIELYSYKSNIEIMKSFSDKITHAYLSNLEKSRKTKKFIYTLTNATYEEDSYERWGETVFESTRTFNNIFFEKKLRVLEKIHFFVQNKAWYYEKGIPYSMGIGIYGPPGTGKTSFIKALSNLTGRHIITISLKMIKSKKQLDSIFFEERYNVNNEKSGITFDKKIIVFEDIDCIGDIVLAREFRKPEQHLLLPQQILTDVTPICVTADKPVQAPKMKLEDPVTLDDLLNLWDGIRETPGRMMILSSNHYDKLDPAIKRPGRIDIALELAYASRNTVKEMHHHFFGTEMEEDVLEKINNHFYSPAEIVNIYMTEERNENNFLQRLMKNEHVI